MGRTVNAAFLAFHYTDASDASPSCPDRIRLDMVQQMYSGIKVFSVSEMKNRVLSLAGSHLTSSVKPSPAPKKVNAALLALHYTTESKADAPICPERVRLDQLQLENPGLLDVLSCWLTTHIKVCA